MDPNPRTAWTPCETLLQSKKRKKEKTAKEPSAQFRLYVILFLSNLTFMLKMTNDSSQFGKIRLLITKKAL